MWRRVYLLLVLVRLWFALSPSYLHPDENFQGPEVIAGKRFVPSWFWGSFLVLSELARGRGCGYGGFGMWLLLAFAARMENSSSKPRSGARSQRQHPAYPQLPQAPAAHCDTR